MGKCGMCTKLHDIWPKRYHFYIFILGNNEPDGGRKSFLDFFGRENCGNIEEPFCTDIRLCQDCFHSRFTYDRNIPFYAGATVYRKLYNKKPIY